MLWSVNISRNWAVVAGVHFAPSLDDIVGLSYGKNRAHFRVKWIGDAERLNAGCVGLLNIGPCETTVGLSTSR